MANRQIGWSQEANLLYYISGQVDRVAQIIANASAGGVISFNTRSGVVTLLSSDVTSALGYTPVTNARTLTINGTAYDLSADRSWTIASGNIYNTNGSLTGNRTVTMGSFTLSFQRDVFINTVRFGTGASNDALSVAAGGLALNAATTGSSSNVAVGYSALYSLTTAASCIGIGYRALYAYQTGDSNVAIGGSSLQSLTTGGSNVALGSATAPSLTFGQGNVIIGGGAAFNLTSSEYNTIIGRTSGSGITTGANNTIIGARVTGLSATLDSNVIISDGNGNQRINSDNLGRVGINTGVTITASAQFEIISTTRGFLAPKMSTAQKNAISTPVAGLQVYDTNLNSLNVYDGSSWIALGAGGGGGMAIGGSITSATAGSVLFAGTAGVLAQNNANFFWDNTNIRLGLAINAPTSTLHILGTQTLQTLTQTITFNNRYITGSDGRNIFLGGGGASITGGAGATSSYNNSFGYQALLSLTTGYYNHAFGFEAGYSTTTGLNNAAFGMRALKANVSGGDNAAFGGNALQNNTSGNNTAIGSQSMITNTGGNYNTAVGFESLKNNTNGVYNTGIGAQALLSTNTGNYNVALGLQAGYGSGGNANTTGSNNIFIGYQSVGASATESNRTWIGNSSTTSTWLGGNLLLGSTTNGAERLQVTGTALITGDTQINGVLRETVTANRQTASYTLALTDRGKLVEMNVASANNLTVPASGTVNFPVGTKIDIAQYGAGQTTVVAAATVTVRSAGGALKLSNQYSGATLVKIATDEWYLFGNITT